MHTTNYTNTLIEVAEDCPAIEGEIPPEGKQRSMAILQFEMIEKSPYKYTSDEVLFSVYATRKDISNSDWEEERINFFSKGQPCFRASPLTKRYGWGVHSDGQGRIAIYGRESEEYEQLVANPAIRKVKAMRSRRK